MASDRSCENPDVLNQRLSRVRLLAMDIDGVLTDGVIAYDDAGYEHKRFCAADGLGLVALHMCEIRTAWISGRRHDGVVRRSGELGVTITCQNVRDKRAAILEVCQSLDIVVGDVAYIGDDWNDLPAMDSVGCPIAVANAAMEVRAAALLVTTRTGGNGAVREVCEAILDARGLKEVALSRYLASLRSTHSQIDRSVM